MSTFKVDTLQSTTGGVTTLTKQSAAKAWVRWNGTGTAAILDSYNIASLTDNNTGDYTFSYNNSMSNTSYSITTSNSSAESNNSQTNPVTISTTSIRFDTRSGATGSNIDTSKPSGTIHGDLA